MYRKIFKSTDQNEILLPLENKQVRKYFVDKILFYTLAPYITITVKCALNFNSYFPGLYLYILVVKTFAGESIKFRIYAVIGWGKLIENINTNFYGTFQINYNEK